MQLTLRFTLNGETHEVTTSLRALVAWERKFKAKMSQMANQIGAEDIAYLAYESAKSVKILVPATFDDFLNKVDGLPEIVSTDNRPTPGEPDDAS